MRVLLASNSPRRRELLKYLVPEFDVRAFPTDENFTGGSPEETVSEIAYRKLCAAESVFGEYDLVIASDTLVYMDGRYYGKPHDRADAVRMLRELSGRTHTVYSAVCVRLHGKISSAVAATEVTFKQLTDPEIYGYIDSHPVTDKAGAYAVQDGIVVKDYKGSYTNIVGLPLEVLSALTGLENRFPSRG